MKPNKPLDTIPIDAIKQTLLPGAQIPSEIDLERAVLGLILIEQSAAREQALLTLSVDSFYDYNHKIIFEAIRSIESKGGQIDLFSVCKQLGDDRKLGGVGGMAYLTGLTQVVASGAHVERHVRYLLECQIGRRLSNIGFNTLRGALDGSDVGEVLEQTQSSLEEVQTVGLAEGRCKHISDISTIALAEARRREESVKAGRNPGIATGFFGLDRLTNGWQAEQLIVLAARPAMGKTALMLHFAISAAKTGVPVRIYSLEMSSRALFDRILMSQSEVNMDSYKGGNLSPSEWAEVDRANKTVVNLPIYIDDKAGVTMRYIATHSKIANRRGQCGLIMIDYLQLVNSFMPGRNREQEVAECSKAAKNIAKELGVPVILLAQLSRSVEGRGGAKKPMLSDLRESGAIEQDADIVVFPHRPEYYAPNGDSEIRLSNGSTVSVPNHRFGEIIVAKQRDGAVGSTFFSHNKYVNRFWDFDERPYLYQPHASGKGAVSSGSINYVPNDIAPADEFDQLPF